MKKTITHRNGGFKQGVEQDHEVSLNELIVLGFKSAYSSFHDSVFIYNLRQNGLMFQWNSEYPNEINISDEKEDIGVSVPIMGMNHIRKIILSVLNIVPNDVVSDTATADSSNQA